MKILKWLAKIFAGILCLVILIVGGYLTFWLARESYYNVEVAQCIEFGRSIPEDLLKRYDLVAGHISCAEPTKRYFAGLVVLIPMFLVLLCSLKAVFFIMEFLFLEWRD